MADAQGGGGAEEEIAHEAPAGPPPPRQSNGQRRFRDGQQVKCQVQGCVAVMSPGQEGVRTSNLRYRICFDHMRAPVLPGYATAQRWCHKCSRRQPVGEFDGDKQTCEKVLRANSARRMQARLDEAGGDGEDVRPMQPRATGPLARAAGGWGDGGARADGRGPGERVRRAAATGASRAQRLDEEEELMESQLAAKRRQRAAAPRAEAPAGAQHFVPPWHGQAAPAPQWMHGGGGGMPHAFGADPVAAAARSTALAAVASGFQHAGGDRNAALGLAAASLLWTDVAHMQAATVAARAMAAGAAGQDGAGANPFAAGGGRHHHAPPAHVAQQMLSVLTAFGVPHGGDPFASYAHAPPQQLHVHPPPPPPPQQPPPIPPEILQALHAAMQQQQQQQPAPVPPPGDEAALAAILQPLLANHLTTPNGGAEVAALLAALQHAAQGPPR